MAEDNNDFIEGSYILPIKRSNKTVQELITEKIRSAILYGELPGGTRLLQNELAQRFGVSNTPIREAIQTLISEGLVQSDPHKGAYVSKISEEEYEIIIHLRKIVETYGIELTIKNITDDEITVASRILKAMKASSDFDEWFELNKKFHDILNQASRSQSLIQVTELLRNLAIFYIPVSQDGQLMHISESNDQHTKLLEAIHNRDVGTATKVISLHSQRKYHRAFKNKKADQ